MHPISFDPDVPLVAASPFNGLTAGDAFDWRARGMSEMDVWPLIRAGLVSPAPTALPAVTVQPAISVVDRDAIASGLRKAVDTALREVAIEMPGITDVELAEKIEQRETAARSQPVAPPSKHKRR